MALEISHSKSVFVSKSYGSLSRLDYALATKDLLPFVQAITYVVQTISDHSLIQVTLTLGHRPAFRVWRLSPLWIATPEIQESIPTDMANYWASNSDTAAMGPVWDALKAVLRGSYISRIKHYRLTGRALQAVLERSLEEARSKHMANPSNITWGKLRPIRHCNYIWLI